MSARLTWFRSVPLSQHLRPLLNRLATVHPSTKFLSIPAGMCIPNYPEKNVPTLLIYRNGDVVGNVIAGMGLKGLRTSVRGELLHKAEHDAPMPDRTVTLSRLDSTCPEHYHGHWLVADTSIDLEDLLIRSRAIEKRSPALRPNDQDDDGSDYDFEDDRENAVGTINSKPGGLRSGANGSRRFNGRNNSDDSDLDM